MWRRSVKSLRSLNPPISRWCASNSGHAGPEMRKLGTTVYAPSMDTKASRKPIRTIVKDLFYRETVDLINDPGRLLMNVGSFCSLTAFAMQDVLLLRVLSITGSLCFVTYNATRTPFPQWNAMVWGFVFIFVNSLMCYKLLTERKEIELNPEEDLLYKNRFQDSEVSLYAYVNLLKHASWKTAAPGQEIVPEDEQLRSVILIHSGKAEAWDYGKDEPTKLYDYNSESRDHNVIVGGTALIDPTVRDKPYPHRVLAATNVVYLEWNIDVLKATMKQNKAIESAFLQLLYSGLVQGLKRSGEPRKDLLEESRMKTYKLLLRTAVSDGFVAPVEKKVIREFSERHGITSRQHERALRAIGWSPAEWDDGALHDTHVISDSDSRAASKLKQIIQTQQKSLEADF